MYAVPDVEEIVATASRVGLSLGPDEAVVFRKSVMAQLDGLDAFVQSRDMAEPVPPMLAPVRGRPYLPTPSEDPLNAWRWKCEIKAETDGTGLLAGKTVSFKDHIAVAGVPTSFGCFALDGFTPDFDATVVTRVLAAGGTIVGKNVMDGLSGGLSMGGAVGDYGRPLNPHNHDHVTGGSSSGSGAAVASGQVDISFGGDQGGSIRIPAALCGTVGHKPTFGLLSHFGIGFGSDQSIDYTGPMTRTVEDAAKAFQATAGFDSLDPRMTREAPLEMDVLGGLKDGVAGLRIGVLQEGFDEADPEVKALVMAAVDKLVALGATSVPVSIPLHHEVRHAQRALGPEGGLALFKTGFFGAFTRTYYPPNLIAAINEMWASHADVLAPRTKLNLIMAEYSRKNYNGRVYAKAQNVRPTFIKAYDDALTQVDLLVMPTCLMTAPKNQRASDYMQALTDSMDTWTGLVSRNTQPFNYTGHPALAVPVGKSSAGLPVSIQLVGRFFDDPLLMRAAYAYEEATK